LDIAVRNGIKLKFTNRMSHTGLRLVSKVVTLNDLEPRNGRYFEYCCTKR